MVKKKKIFEYISMHFFWFEPRTPAPGHVGPFDLHLNLFGKGPQAMLHIKFQAFGRRGSEEDFFLNIFQCISMVRTYDPLPRAILYPGTFI